MFQSSDYMRDKTMTVICKIMKRTQNHDWFDILRREFYFVPIGRGKIVGVIQKNLTDIFHAATNLLELMMENNVGPKYIENSLAIISCIPST